MICYRSDKVVKPAEKKIKAEVTPTSPESLGSPFELENFIAKSPIKVGYYVLAYHLIPKYFV